MTSFDEKQTSIIASIRQDAAVPTIKNAYIEKNSNYNTINTFWTQRNYTVNKDQSSLLLYTYEQENGQVSVRKKTNLPVPTSPYALQTLSPSGILLAQIFKKKNEDTSKDEFILEIWSNDGRGCIKSFNLNSFGKHDHVHGDSVFSSLCWSSNERKIVYLAEKKKPKSSGFFEAKVDDENGDKKAAQNKGDKFLFEETWGEQLTEVKKPVICVIDIVERTLELLDNVSSDISPAQPQFKGNDVILFEGIKNTPFRLGRIYCENRDSEIYAVNLESTSNVSTLITSAYKTTNYCPRVSPNGKKVIFFRKILNEYGDPHCSAENIAIYDFESNTLKEIKKLVCNDGEFEIYSICDLPQHCWFDDDVNFALVCAINFKQYLIILNTQTGKVIMKYECFSYFGVYSNIVLTSFMKLDSKYCSLQISTLNSFVMENHLKDEHIEVHELHDNGMISYAVLSNQPTMVTGKLPVLMIPHGGPHGVIRDLYSATVLAFCKIGFAVILTNYRGSTSHTMESLLSLPGKIGVQDVHDVYNVLQLGLKKMDSVCDVDNIFIFGGSHGGFLGAHHIGQFPEVYKAAALLNPVIDVSSMSTTSDIIDWTYVESGIPYQQSLLPSGENLSRMVELSPIRYTKNIKAPVLLCVGLKDKRVPPSQSVFYYKILKANNKKVKLLCYPNDCHPLSSVEADGDMFVNVCRWFLENSSNMEFR